MRTGSFDVVVKGAWTALVYIFMLAPIVVLVLASFDDAPVFIFPPKRFSLRWYEAAVSSTEYGSAIVNSLLVALIAGLVSVGFGSLAAYALARGRLSHRRWIEAILMAPLVLPLIVWSIALIQIYAWLGISGTFLSLVLAHALITLPFTVRIMLSTFERMDPLLEAAAASLGARPAVVVCRIIVPLCVPGFVSSAAFSLLVSFNDVVVSSLIAGSRWLTFPVRLYSQLRGQGIDPTTLALGTIIIAAILVTVVAGELLFKWSRHL